MNTLCHTLLLAPIVASVATCVPAEPANSSATTPEETVAQFFVALQSHDTEAAARLCVPLDNAPQEAQREWREGLVDPDIVQHSAEIIESKVLEDTAIVVINEHVVRADAPQIPQIGRDIDPVYLVQMHGGWRIVPEISEFDSPFFALSASRMNRLSELQSWYTANKQTFKDSAGTGGP